MNHPAENISLHPDETSLIGLWDLRTEPLTLGGVLILAVELLVRSEIDGTRATGICFIQDDDHPVPPGLEPPTGDGLHRLTSATFGGSSVVTTMMDIGGMEDCYVSNSLSAVRAHLKQSPQKVVSWPDPGIDETPLQHEYLSAINLVEFFRTRGRIPQIQFKPGPIKRASDLLKLDVSPNLPVIVHLKNEPANVGMTPNAFLDVWENFMRTHAADGDVTFVVIGNEDPGPLRGIPNVVITQDSGNDLARDLALIQMAPFMGTASGPSQMVVLGDQPYALFKPLDVHREFMDRELNGQSNFVFASPHQYILRIAPTVEDLTKALESIRASATGHCIPA